MIPIAKEWAGHSWSEIAVGWLHRSDIQEPLPWNELPSLPCPVMREQPTKSGIVPQYSIEAAEGRFLSGPIDDPGCIGLGADLLPDFLAKIVGDGLANRGPQHESEDFGLGAGVVPPGPGRSGGRVELRDTGDGVPLR